ncbi:MAG: Na+/H+ antiporter subunit E [Pseudomonadota bacterium]
MTPRWRMVVAVMLLFLVWLGWSGHLEPLLLLLGLASCVLVVGLSARMGTFDEESSWVRVVLRLPGFWAWIIGEVVRSNLEVAKLILGPRPRLSPTLVTLEADELDSLGQATLGNCITLTPGTVTLDDHQGELLVHCITQGNARELLQGEMKRRVAALTRH